MNSVRHNGSLAASSPMLIAVEQLAKTLIGVPQAANGARKPGVISRLMNAMAVRRALHQWAL